MDTNQLQPRLWAEPSAPDQAEEARYRRAVLGGLSQAEFEAQEAAADAAIDEEIERSKALCAGDVPRWDAIFRAAACAAAEAIKSRNWDAKRHALAVMAQAAEGRDRVVAAIFGARREIPAQYAGLERAGAHIQRGDVAEAMAVIAADKQQARRSDLAQPRAAAAEPAAVTAPTTPVGADVRASRPYKLAKATDDLCYLGGELAHVPGVQDGDTVRVTAHTSGRAYGKKYVMVGVVVK